MALSPTQTYVRALRRLELMDALAHFPEGGRVLEIGGATGEQARLMADLGWQVTSIDVSAPPGEGEPAFPVVLYDGKSLPFADDSFDVVYSSNTLEHIPHVAAFQREILRVLRDGGIAVHVLPSAAWRFWTMASHYAALPREGLSRLAARGGRGAPSARQVLRASPRADPWRIVFPGRHGEHGGALWELYGFSRWRWRALFERTGWRVRTRRPARLFYTGHVIAGSRLPFGIRRALSRVLGSSTHLFVLEPAEGAAHGDEAEG